MTNKTKPAKKAYEIILPIILPVLFLIVWLVWITLINPNTKLPSPIDIINRAVSMSIHGQIDYSQIAHSQLADYTWITSRRAIIGLIAGGGAGFLFGMINAIFRLADISMKLTIQMLKKIPVLAFITLVLVLFGIGENVKIALIACDVFFSVYISIYGGIKSIDAGLIEMGKAYGLNKVTQFKEIIFPVVFSYLCIGLRLSLRSMWLVLIAVELLIPKDGVGYMAMDAVKSGQMDQLVLSVIVYALLSKLSDGLVRALERNVLSWKDTPGT